MAVPADQPLSASIKWEDTAIQLKDFISKHEVPNIVKVTKGQYRNIGVAKSVTSELYLHSVKKSKKVFAEGVKVKEGKRITIVDQKFSLPVTYQGWFELLSEDGKAIKPIQSVQELTRVFPQRCLVRENMKVCLASRDTGEVSSERTRLLSTGEQLSLVGDVYVPVPGAKVNTRRKLLKCFDQQGESIFLSADQKGLFSPIAGQGNISGVHNIKGMLEKFRLPIMVRLVHGIIPSRLDKSSFTGVFRLLNVYNDETAFVCPLRKDAKMVPISTREALKVIATQNIEDIRDLEEVKYYHLRCGKMIASYLNSIHVLVNPPDPGAIARGGPDKESFHKQHADEVSVAGSHDRKPAITTTSNPSVKNGVTEEDILFDEIDDIYQFVRDGGRPPAPRPRPPYLRKSDPTPVPPTVNGTKAEPRSLSQGNNRASGPDLQASVSKGLKVMRTGSKGDLVRLDQRHGAATAIINKSGSVDILNSSASPSPEDTSPATTLSYQKQEKDEHYWEEPIYEEIKQRYKKATISKKDTPLPNAPLATSTTADVGSSPGGAPSSSSPSRGDFHREPVENLRQMYKLQTSTSESRMSFHDTCDEDSEEGVTAPPTPPKRYESAHYSISTPTSTTVTPEHKPSPDQRAFTKRNSMPSLYQSPSPKAANEEYRTVHDRIASINSANTSATARIDTSAYIPSQPPQGRYVRANAVHGSAGRSHGIPSSQYVAFARVGPSTSQGSHKGSHNSGSHYNKDIPRRDRPERQSERSPRTAYSRVESIRRKLQGLYL